MFRTGFKTVDDNVAEIQDCLAVFVQGEGPDRDIVPYLTGRGDEANLPAG